MKHNHTRKFDGRNNNSAGFSLIELLVALAIFMVIGGAAVSLVRRHVPLASSVQNQVGLTMTLRNAIAQMEIDVVNAGTGYYTGANIADWPIGVTIQNNVSTACNNPANFTYGASCFDKLNVIAADTNVPPTHPSSSATAAVDIDTSVNADVFLTPPAGITPAAFAANFHNGDYLLWLHTNTSGTSTLTTTVLTADGVVQGSTAHLTYTKTSTSGVDPSDTLQIANPGDAPTGSSVLWTAFSSANDWVIKLNPITYQVDVSNATNPKLVRQQGGTTDVVAEQIIGFRIGASARIGLVDEPYSFNAAAASPSSGCTSSCGYGNDWSQVRSLRISLIARTPPRSDPTDTFRNSFDGGPYRIQGASVTINPRNLSMNDQ
jgi:prepilin-type N-terminal cleavage/methylation domain-containing protein